MFARLREESAAANTAAEAGGVDAEADGADAAKPRVVKPLSMDVFSEDWNESQFWVSFWVCARVVCLSGGPPACLSVCRIGWR